MVSCSFAYMQERKKDKRRSWGKREKKKTKRKEGS